MFPKSKLEGYGRTFCFKRAWRGSVCAKVMRRTQYRGSTRLTYTLPIDAASTMGILVVIGTILPAASLSAEALGQCKQMMKSLEKYSACHEIVAVTPEGRELRLEANGQNLFLLADLKHLWKKLSLNFTRLGMRLGRNERTVLTDLNQI